MITNDERFLEIQGILLFSNLDIEACTKINDLIIELSKERNQFEDNWNTLKQKMIDSFNKTQDVQFLDVLQDIEKLEKGSDSNE